MSNTIVCYRCGQPVSTLGECGCEDGVCLIHGDCRKILSVFDDGIGNLVLTDPPWGVGYVGGRTKKREQLVGDDSASLYADVLPLLVRKMDDKAAFYLFHALGSAVALVAVGTAVIDAGLVVRSAIIWNKHQAQFGALGAQYKQKHDPILYCHKKGKAPRWYGPTNEVSVWDGKRLSRCDLHPTQKPPWLMMRAIRNSSEIGDLVFDPFAGSGTTGRACKDLGRRCILIEIKEKYCKVATKRLRKSALGVLAQQPIKRSRPKPTGFGMTK